MSHLSDTQYSDRLPVLVALYLVQTNLLISFAATGVAVSTMVLAGIPIRPLPLFIVFAVTMFVYSFNRLSDYAEDKQNLPTRAVFISRYGRPLLALGGGLYAVAIAVAVWLRVPAAPALAIPVVVAVLYSTVGLKRILLVKNLLVGVSWGLIPVGVGVFYSRLGSFDVQFFAAFSAVMLTIAAVVFDIKDIEGDSEQGIRTVPVILGAKRTRQLAAGATAVVGAVLVGLLARGVLSVKYVVLLGFVAYVFGYCLVATRDRGPLFYGFVIDSEHIWLAVVLVALEWGGWV
jgi:4-hydroxybenzoate polyprenyltransferase